MLTLFVGDLKKSFCEEFSVSFSHQIMNGALMGGGGKK